MSLLIVVPVSQSDVHLLDPFVSVLEHFGGLEKNNVLVAAGSDVTEEASAAAARLRRIAKSATLFTIPPPQGGWPRACNDHFQRTVNRLRDNKNAEPFLWMELDAFPIKAGWSGALQGAYNEAGLPFLGRKVLTMDCCPNPDHSSAKVLFDGYHMNGVGVYPPDFHLRSQLYKMANRERVAQPWDIYCRWEIAPHCHDAGLIIGALRATQFKAIDGGYSYVSDDGTTKEAIVGDEALLHSCKDASLAALITGKTFEAARQDALAESSAESNVAQGEPAQGALSSPHETKTSADSPLLVKVLEALPEVGSKLMLGKLSAKVSTEKALVKAALESSGKFTIKGPAEWVERTAA